MTLLTMTPSLDKKLTTRNSVHVTTADVERRCNTSLTKLTDYRVVDDDLTFRRCLKREIFTASCPRD